MDKVKKAFDAFSLLLIWIANYIMSLIFDQDYIQSSRIRIHARLKNDGGVMSSLYKATYGRMLVVLKIPHYMEDFEREKTALRTISRHYPQQSVVIRMFGHTIESGHSGLVIEYMNQGTLTAWVGKTSLHQRQAFRICFSVAKALEMTHAVGLVHCDVKPPNVLIGADAINAPVQAKLADFGLSDNVSVLLAQKNCRGSLTYCAPELLVGNHGNTIKSDVYAYGMTVRDCLDSGQTGLPDSGEKYTICILQGQRPALKLPDACGRADIKLALVARYAWQQQAFLRPTASQVVAELATGNEISECLRAYSP